MPLSRRPLFPSTRLPLAALPPPSAMLDFFASGVDGGADVANPARSNNVAGSFSSCTLPQAMKSSSKVPILRWRRGVAMVVQ